METHYRKTKRHPRNKLKDTELVGIKAPQDMIELVLWSLFVAGERLVCLLFLADPESGKTELMKKYRFNPGVLVYRRFTPYGIIRDLKKNKIQLLFKHLKILGILVVYDLSDILATLKHNTMEGVIRFLNALTQEGLSRESLYWTKGKTLKILEGVTGGIITALTPSGFFRKDGKPRPFLYKGGWLSRVLVFSYSLSEIIKSKITESIANQEYRSDKNFVDSINLNFPNKRSDVKILEGHSQEIIDIAEKVVEEYNEDLDTKLQGFRLQKSLISLAKASALRDGRKVVMDRDIERIRYLSNWFNLKMKPLKNNYPFK